MSSLSGSLLFFRCVSPVSGPSSGFFSSSRARKRSCPKLSCKWTSLQSSTSATPHSNILHSASETEDLVGCDSPQTSERSALQSLLSLVVALAMTIGIQGAPSSRDTFEDVPQTLSGGDRGQRIQKPKSAKAESCTQKCVSTCVRGGAGSGEGPLNVRRPLVVFKEGFRSRQYCLVECSDICNIIGDGMQIVACRVMFVVSKSDPGLGPEDEVLDVGNKHPLMVSFSRFNSNQLGCEFLESITSRTIGFRALRGLSSCAYLTSHDSQILTIQFTK